MCSTRAVIPRSPCGVTRVELVTTSTQPDSVSPKKRRAIPTIHTQRILALILLICQAGITFTGAIVRVTASGLGCPTWPECQPGSLVPVAGTTPALHQAIEFGNRLLTFVLVAACVAVLITLIKAKRRLELLILGWISIGGIILQAVIGGISVHLQLRWWSVAIHFLPSMALVWVAALLFVRLKQPDDGIPERTFPRAIRALALISAIALSIVLITGTMVTGAGVHSGDDQIGMSGRLAVDIDMMAHIHAYCMYTYLFLTIIMVFLLHRYKAPTESKIISYWLIGMIVLQAAIGIMQYNLQVPRWSVPIHVLMSSVVVIFSAFLYASGYRVAGGIATRTGSPEAERIH
ncbi:heme A synthase [Corynebacterium sp. 3HC-13]|nr:heme A synthase [Corynebacterium poyangense]